MKEIELIGLDQNIYFEELSNGLKVILIPFKTKRDYYVTYTSKYGSINLDFIPEDSKDVYNSPKGIAHFLEHKMFEQKSGDDPFTFFSKSGTSCNAGTSYKKTSYFIYGINNLKENLDYLINFVNDPYFTDENVEKEKGIIIEEIKMYDDNPDWILSEEIQKATFKIHPIRYDIAGYVDTVSSITKEDLYKCYDAFYAPSNMLLVVSGKFDKDEVISLIKSNEKLNARSKKSEPKLVKDKEPEKVNKKYEELTLPNIVVPKIAINFKIPLKDIKNRYEYNIYVSALISILFGPGSSFKEDIFSKGYASDISCDKMLVDEFLVIEFYIEGNKPKELLDEICKRFNEEEITEEQFNRYKKVLRANYVMDSDNIQNIADDIISDYINWGKIIDNKIEIIKEINFKEFLSVREKIDLDNNATIILKGK